MIICAGNVEYFKFATAIGVGLIDSSINLTKICLFNPPEFLLFVGTAGSYGKVKIFDIVESETASNIEHSFFLNSSYTPINNIISTQKNNNGYIVNSSNYITSNKIISNKYLEKNIDLENMEFYSVLKVAEKFNIPVKGVFIISNFCDENAHKIFQENHELSMNKISQYILNKKNLHK